MIFPKVRLGDFLEVTLKGKGSWKWWNKIKSKHIDFLIWDSEKEKLVLAIELDGGSHKSRDRQKRDKFVNKVYKESGLTLKRVKVGSDFTKEAQKIKQYLNSQESGEEK